jgi:hypothetical protein
MAANEHTLNKIIDNAFRPTLKPGTKINALDLQYALFDDLVLRSQNNAFYKKLKPDFIEKLKKGYMDEINKQPTHPKQDTYKQVVNGAFKLFNLSLLFRLALFAGPKLELLMGSDSSRKRQAMLEQEDRRHQKRLEENEEQEEEEKEEEEEEKLVEGRLAKKKNDEEEEKEKHSPFRELGKSIGHALVLLASQKLEDREKIAENLSHNILELNKNLQETLKLKPSPEHSNKLNKDIADFGQTLKQAADPQDPNRQRDIHNQFDKVLISIRNQRDYFKEQLDKTHPNNSQAQQLLLKWEAEVGKNLTQMISSGNVQKYDNTFKDKLAKDWNAVAANSSLEGLSASSRPLTLAATAATTLQNTLDPAPGSVAPSGVVKTDPAAALKDDQGQAARKKQGPFAIRPPKPGAPH